MKVAKKVSREQLQAAECLSERLHGERARVNAFVLRLQATDCTQHKEEEEKATKEESVGLFDACVANPYEERRIIGKCENVKRLLEIPLEKV